MHSRRKTVENILLINPMLCGLQDKLEREQETVIADLCSPAERIVARLIDIDNKRIDLCNLAVLYGFIERGLGEKFGLLKSCVFAGADCDYFDEAASQLHCAGYDVERVNKEFGYLFKLIKRTRPKNKIVKVLSAELRSVF